MPWEVVAGVANPPPVGQKYHRMILPNGISGQAFGVSMTSPSLANSFRLRVGFYYPLFLASGVSFIGASEEMMGGQGMEDSPIHFVSFGHVPTSVRNAETSEEYGVLIAPDRGITEGICRLWRYTL